MQNYTDSPYKKIPADLASKYTMDNQIPVFDWWLDARDDINNNNIIWNDDYITNFCNRFTPDNIRNNKACSLFWTTYCSEYTYLIRSSQHYLNSHANNFNNLKKFKMVGLVHSVYLLF